MSFFVLSTFCSASAVDEKLDERIKTKTSHVRLCESWRNLRQFDYLKINKKIYKEKFLENQKNWNRLWNVASISKKSGQLWPAWRTEDGSISRSLGYFCLEQTSFLWIVILAEIIKAMLYVLILKYYKVNENYKFWLYLVGNYFFVVLLKKSWPGSFMISV